MEKLLKVARITGNFSEAALAVCVVLSTVQTFLATRKAKREEKQAAESLQACPEKL